MTFENLADWGHCLCAVCPAPTVIVTSGVNAVVCVWELSVVKGRPRGLHLQQVGDPAGDPAGVDTEQVQDPQPVCALGRCSA